MYFLIVISALILNALTARFFRPYTGWQIRLHVAASKYFSKKKYKTCTLWGKLIMVIGVVVIWASVDVAVMLMQYQSEVYLYIVTALTVYFGITCGQFSGMLKRLAKYADNEAYTRELFGYMLISNADSIDKQKFHKAFTLASARIIAEKIITPGLLLAIFGNGAVVAYLFLNNMARSDNSRDVRTHGYQSGAITVNGVVNIPAYAVLSLLLWVIKWIFNMKFSFKDRNVKEKCMKQISAFSRNNEYSREYIKTVKMLMWFAAVLAMLVFVSVYIFIQTTLAAIGLDEYWDFWSGESIGK